MLLALDGAVFRCLLKVWCVGAVARFSTVLAYTVAKLGRVLSAMTIYVERYHPSNCLSILNHFKFVHFGPLPFLWNAPAVSRKWSYLHGFSIYGSKTRAGIEPYDYMRRAAPFLLLS